ncbi:MAG: T9SS type A sorting domain-containing protein [bacterium]|nr:T9SS type A sorting domain-containing protein [bacterium]
MYCNILGSDTSSTDGVVSFKPYNNTNNTLANCLIANYDNNLPSFGIKIFNDYQSGQGGSHQTVIDCEIKNFKKAGIEIHIADNSSLIGNIIHNELEVSSNSLSGINCYARHVTISKCKIYDLISSELNSNDVYGIKILRGWGGVVDNNFISLSGNEQSSITGIYLKGELFIGYYFYYNSINIFGNCENSEGSSCLKRDWTLTENPSLYPPWYLLNNILVNKRVNTSGNGIHLAIDSNDPYYSADYDYNNYYVAPSNNYIGKWINTYASNIEEWKILSNRDPNSVSTDVIFISDTDLHLTGSSIGDSLLIGIPISGITHDIDGELRDPISPYKGADEVDSPVVITETIKKPSNYSLFQNYPNPFNSSTTIAYGLPKATYVSLIIYDCLANNVRTLVNEVQAAGTHYVVFESNNLSSGIYFMRIRAENWDETKRIIILK